VSPPPVGQVVMLAFDDGWCVDAAAGVAHPSKHASRPSHNESAVAVIDRSAKKVMPDLSLTEREASYASFPSFATGTRPA
jgi:hypothetical protein